jgi:hypothetical protein
MLAAPAAFQLQSANYPIRRLKILFQPPAIVLSLKFVEEVIDLEEGCRCVILARQLCLPREESRIPGPFARQLYGPGT